jgi:hypothetical protein
MKLQFPLNLSLRHPPTPTGDNLPKIIQDKYGRGENLRRVGGLIRRGVAFPVVIFVVGKFFKGKPKNVAFSENSSTQ